LSQSKNGEPDHIYTALQKGPRKMQNVLIIGPSDCGKSHLLEPLTLLFSAFPKPVSGSTFALEPLEKYEVVLCNEVEFDRTILSWQDWLNWLDGKAFCIPKKGVENYYHKPCAPFFGTAGGRVLHPKRDAHQERMMDNRIRYFELYRPYSDRDVDRTIEPCGRCFATWLLANRSS
jgi:energy-coupling factor transporter ATP-binding protein EcfA2